ncbi:TIGR02300 family protein [uncultured Lentibacter sp.]|jgi:uncharacterized protein (TIGR02300 family)|uniref:TIGR02300 family protein n=1 Tax=uncultured Lentibacter sp. TaxID=1659309 RepID=UPI002623B8F9|nr:TIGR02300 family protein [uncultured Lentibacter sp.]
MPKEEWGIKRLCPTTGKRFYDLNKTPCISPYTGEVVEFDNNKKSLIAADQEDAVTLKAKEAEDDLEVDVLEDDVDVDLDDDDVLEDDEDDDNVSLDDLADVAAEGTDDD